jgi:hypothetical protein
VIPIVRNRGRLTECRTRFPGDLIYQTFCKRCNQCNLWKPAKKKRKAVVKHSAMERIAMWWATIKAEEAA